MKVLITRSEMRNGETAALLAAEGHAGIECPLVEIVDTGAAIPDVEFGGVIVTSQAALEVLVRREKSGRLIARSLDIYAVGKKTAKFARELGFTNILIGEGGAAKLSELIHQKAVKKTLLYLAGIDRAFEFVAFETTVIEIYEARLIDPGKDRLHLALSQISNGCALLYSARTATHLFELISQYNLEKDIENVTFIAISKQVAEAVASMINLPVLTAAKPSHAAMIELLGKIK